MKLSVIYAHKCSITKRKIADMYFVFYPLGECNGNCSSFRYGYERIVSSCTHDQQHPVQIKVADSEKASEH